MRNVKTFGLDQLSDDTYHHINKSLLLGDLIQKYKGICIAADRSCCKTNVCMYVISERLQSPTPGVITA